MIIPLNVPIAEKERFKALCKKENITYFWDPNQKVWKVQPKTKHSLPNSLKEFLPKKPVSITKEALIEALHTGLLSRYKKTILEAPLQTCNKMGWNLFHYAAYHGLLHEIPEELLTPKNLRIKNKDKEDCFHLAAFNGNLKQIPKNLLTLENLLTQSEMLEGLHKYRRIYKEKGISIEKEGRKSVFPKNCFQLAAYNGHLNDIPTELLTEENLLLRDEYGETSFHKAAWNGKISKIPAQFLTEKNLLQEDDDGDNCFHYSAEKGFIADIPKAFLTVKNLLTPNKFGNTSFHTAAEYGNFPQIPSQFLTSDTVGISNENGETLLHYASKYGNLPQIPREFLTEEALTKQDKKHGNTCLHHIAKKEQLPLLPPNIDPKAFLIENKSGKNCLHICAYYGRLKHLPQELLTLENLTKPNREGETPLHKAAINGFLGRLPEIPLKTLKNLKRAFKSDQSQYKQEILECIERKIRSALIRNSLTQDHQALY
jgi:ankyrin repeat protein